MSKKKIDESKNNEVLIQKTNLKTNQHELHSLNEQLEAFADLLIDQYLIKNHEKKQD